LAALGFPQFVDVLIGADVIDVLRKSVNDREIPDV
jgi:hypothetical protein